VRREGKLVPLPYDEMLPQLRREIAEAVSKDAGGTVAVLSPFLTCEEAYLAAKYFKGLSGEVKLALGPVPVVGEDDTYPKDRHGKPLEQVKFTIRAEKCPNRRGVEEVLRHFQGDVMRFDDVVWQTGEGKFRTVYLAAGYPPRGSGWITAQHADTLTKATLLIVQDLMPSPISEKAKFVVPSASFAEKDGTFVNHAGLAQAIHRAVRPPQECRTDGQVFIDLQERRGLAHAPTLRAELAKEVRYFAGLGNGDLGEHGVRLEAERGA
jgi:NADH-quinone oxidoreductase subunit G